MEGTKNSDIRVNNRKRLVNLLFRHGAMTKQDISDRLDISLPTATLLLKELIAKGLIVKGDTLDSTGGRKPVRLEPVYQVRYAIGIEVSMHEIRIVMMDLGLNVLAKESYSKGIRYDRAYWEMVNTLLEEFIAANVPDRRLLLDIGLTLQLPMNEDGLIWKINTPDSEKLDIKMVESCFSGNVNVRNSAKMAAVAQIWAGAQTSNFVFLTVGSFIGGAIIHDRAVLDFTGMNGQFGAMYSAGRHVSDMLAAQNLMERAGENDIDQLFSRIRCGDPSCTAVWDEYLGVLSRLIYNLHQMMGWKVVIGGALSPYFEPFMPEICRRIAELEEYFVPDRDYVQISDLGVYGAAMGAGMISIDLFLNDGIYDM